MPNEIQEGCADGGGNAPAAVTEPRVLYVGPDATTVADRWNDGDRPYRLIPADEADPLAALEDGRIDSVVCHSDGSVDCAAVLHGVRDRSERLPIVVFATEDGLDAATAMAAGATYIQVPVDLDPLDRLAQVAPVVSRHREEIQTRSMLDSLLEHIPLSVYFKDRQSRHVQVSDSMLSMIGPDYMENPEGKRFHTPEDVVGITDFDLYPPELAESATADDRTVMETEEPIVDRVEHSFGSPHDGTYVATSKAPWYDADGNVIGMVGVTRDISERMQYEHQLERQNERLERFAKVISHDLRNPLEVARGRLDLLVAGEEPDEHVEAIDRSLTRMDELINDVLTLAREGEVVADPEPTDLATIAEAAWAHVDAPDARLAVETDADILCDPSRLQQLLENVFRNAVEHGRPSTEEPRTATTDGSDGRDEDTPADTDPAEGEVPTLTITVGELPYHGFYVADDGVGIPADEREDIFEPGFSRNESGTGLGLGIVRTIAEAHGWTVEATESEDGGARFVFHDVRRAV